MTRLVVAALTAILAGCLTTSTSSSSIGYPAEPTTLQYGLRDRCGEGGPMDCSERAFSVIDQIVVSLGPLVAPAEPDATIALPFIVDADQSEGWDWRASNGDSGSTARVRVDLAPYLDGSGDAELRFGEDGPGYAVPDELAESLVLALYVRDE